MDINLNLHVKSLYYKTSMSLHYIKIIMMHNVVLLSSRPTHPPLSRISLSTTSSHQPPLKLHTCSTGRDLPTNKLFWLSVVVTDDKYKQQVLCDCFKMMEGILFVCVMTGHVSFIVLVFCFCLFKVNGLHLFKVLSKVFKWPCHV